MSKQRSIYVRRRVLRALESGWGHLDVWINRFSTVNERTRPYNPFYHLGTLAIFLLIVLTVTGVYLTLFYRPGTERAYASVVAISDSWLGSIMRGVHRYAADGLIVVTLLHALRMLFSDRFWGSRWLAWVSGWVMVVLFWVLGLMGYWLIWDQAAQWLTEYFIQLSTGPFAYAFYGANVSAATFSLFVIVLFLHIFLPLLLVVGIVIHVLRLQRVNYWTPRWLMATSVGGLVLLSLWQPVTSALPADLTTLVETTSLDWLYMGFLPLTDLLGNWLFWGISLLALAVAVALPWLWRGQHDGPAYVIPPNCTGCGACARECPFEAIEMVQRDDETLYSSLAVVTPDLCTGCGICVGACPDKAIELDRLPSAVVRQDLQRTLSQADKAGDPVITVYTCERHDTLGTLPPLAERQTLETADVAVGGSIPLLQAKLPPRVNVGVWADSHGRQHPVMTCVVPCTGMLHPNWAAETIEAGGAGAIVVSCPAHDCSYREGPHWISNRLKRRRTLRKGNVHFWELAPGSRQELKSLWSLMVGDEDQAQEARRAVTAVGRPRAEQPQPSRWSHARHLLTGLVILLVVLLLSMAVYQPAGATLPEEGQIKLVINHPGQLMATTDNLPEEIAAKLPENVDPAQVLGGERFPVHLRLLVDGEVVLEKTYEPRGLRREGSIYGVEAEWLPPGEYAVEVQLMDDETEWRTVFDEAMVVPQGGARKLLFDESEGVFVQG